MLTDANNEFCARKMRENPSKAHLWEAMRRFANAAPFPLEERSIVNSGSWVMLAAMEMGLEGDDEKAVVANIADNLYVPFDRWGVFERRDHEEYERKLREGIAAVMRTAAQLKEQGWRPTLPPPDPVQPRDEKPPIPDYQEQIFIAMRVWQKMQYRDTGVIASDRKAAQMFREPQIWSTTRSQSNSYNEWLQTLPVKMRPPRDPRGGRTR